jgi:alpha-glucosidase
MQWNSEPWAGFSPPGTEETWLPLADDYRERNVQAQLEQPDSILQFYRRMLSFRRAHPVLQTGRYRPWPDQPEDCYLYLRESPDQTYLICLNFSGEPQTLPGLPLENAQRLLSTHLAREGALESPLTLKPNEGCVLKL